MRAGFEPVPNRSRPCSSYGAGLHSSEAVRHLDGLIDDRQVTCTPRAARTGMGAWWRDARCQRTARRTSGARPSGVTWGDGWSRPAGRSTIPARARRIRRTTVRRRTGARRPVGGLVRVSLGLAQGRALTTQRSAAQRSGSNDFASARGAMKSRSHPAASLESGMASKLSPAACRVSSDRPRTPPRSRGGETTGRRPWRPVRHRPERLPEGWRVRRS